MSDQENFLTRWARRKRDAANENAQSATPAANEADKPAVQGEKPDQSVAARSPEASVPEFDLTKLPSLESIGANSDITAFLQPGVPSALRHAALRRAWVADPAIRDFVGLAENAWDFTVPDGAPGFGELDLNYDVKKLLAEIFGEAKPEAASQEEGSAPAPRSAQLRDNRDAAAVVPTASEPITADLQGLAVVKNDSLLQRGENVAMHPDDSKEESAAIKVSRHGGAMPQ